MEWAIGETADAVIARKVRSAARAREIEVVTSDEQVLRAIASCGAQGHPQPGVSRRDRRAFADEPAAEKPEASSPAEVAEWLDLFGDGR